ncbi:hypothetical protein O9929_16935 [Vibrio lentus]|nr:hypothetical protein [Vibrio lentus]
MFITVAQEQSLSSLGKLCVTTPAVSQNIKIEALFGVKSCLCYLVRVFIPTHYPDNLYLRAYPILE